MSVQFDGTKMFFDFINLDLLEHENEEPEFLTKIEYEKFSATDASAIFMLPLEHLNGLFWYRVCDRDLSEQNQTSFAMFPDSWPELSFSSSMVTPESAVSRSKKDFTISEDFVRSIIRDIMGNIGFNCLFSNLEEMKAGVVSLDEQFNTLLRNKISMAGGTFESPKTLADMSPTGHLWNAIINQEDTLDERRIMFIEQINEKTKDYKNNYDGVTFYYYGNDGVHGEGYYYPLYLSQQPGTERIQFQADQEFYIGSPNRRGVPFVDIPGIIDYRQYETPFLPIDFLKDDIIKIRLTYHHSETQIYNKDIRPRSYMLHLKLF